MPAKNCPRCKLINPQAAEVCDCGHLFVSGSAESRRLADIYTNNYEMTKNLESGRNKWIIFRVLRLIIKIFVR